MRLVGYVRVSSESQLDGYGLEVQRKAIRSWAKANSHKLVRIEEDAGVSGAKDAGDRPGLTAALETLREHEAAGLVVARLDRLARALHVQEAALEVAWRAGATVFAVDQGEVRKDDPDDPMRDAIRKMQGVFAELDRKLVVKRLRDGRKAKAARGKKAVGAYAFGTIGDGTGKDRDAVPHPEESVAVERILDLRRQGLPYRVIATTLDGEGFKPRRASNWSAMSVRAVCQRDATVKGCRS